MSNSIGVIGFGKIGQAVVAKLISRGCNVVAIDNNTALVESVRTNNYVYAEAGISDLLEPAFTAGSFQLSNTLADIKGCDAIIVTIPLLIDNEKRIRAKEFLSLFTPLAELTEKAVPVIIETTIPVHFTRREVLPAMEASGRKHGIDFLLVYSPERIKSGTMLQQLSDTRKLIGGIDEKAGDAAFEIYSRFIDKSLLEVVKDVETAEFIKLAGMAYRDVNIALSNQLAMLADSAEIDYRGVLPLINADGESALLTPGIGVGGHCTPVYPYFLLENFENAGLQFSLGKESRIINDGMAAYACSKIADMEKGQRVLILGLAFRPGVKEDAFSTAYLLKDELIALGHHVLLHDPLYTADEIKAKGFTPEEDIYATKANVVFLVTSHPEYRKLELSRLALSGIKVAVDGRGAWDASSFEVAGIKYFGIGN